MGQLTAATKVYAVMGSGAVTMTTATGIILDSDADSAFAATNSRDAFGHRGMNLHHMIYATPALSKKISIHYSFDGTNFFTVFTAVADGDAVYWDTGRNIPAVKPLTTTLASGGGAMSCPPTLVKITATGDSDLELLSVKTYGTVVR